MPARRQRYLAARINVDGGGTGIVVTLRKPAGLSQLRYSRKVKTFPSSVCRSMFKPNSSGIAGPVRASFGTYSAMSNFPPARSAAWDFNKSSEERRVGKE